MKKVEFKLKNHPKDEVILDDVFSNSINLGENPRLLFAGEESGGMIMGTEELITSLHGRLAIAMREKSATEAIIVTSALVAQLEQEKISLSKYLVKVFDENKITGRYDTRVDIAYYNESEPDINELKKAKSLGEKMRTQNDLFYLSLAMGVKENVITIENVKNILSDTFKNLDFSNLKSIKFVGDGTYMEFADKYIEIRPSGTDAKTKAYGGGLNKNDIETFASALGNYSGERTVLHRKFITDNFYNTAKDKAMNYYFNFVDKDANKEIFEIPDYQQLI